MRSRAARLLPWALFAATTFAACGQKDPAARPKIAFDRVEHDYGVVRQQADLSTKFTVRNEGGGVMHAAVRGDCGCTTPTISADEIPSGGSATIEVTFHTGTFVGRQTKHLRVTSNDPEKPEVSLELRIEVAAGIVVHPAHFFFNQALLGSSPTAEITLKWKEGVGKPFQVLGVEATPQVPGSAPPDVVFDTKPFEEAPWHGHVVTMRFTKPPPIGFLTGTALLRTDDPDTPRIQALIGGSISGKVNVSMRTPSFGIVIEGKGATLPIHVMPFDKTVDLGTVTAKARKGRVQTEVKKNPDMPGAFIVEIRLPESAAPGEIDDVVDVKTAVAGEETLELRVSGSIVPKAR